MGTAPRPTRSRFIATLRLRIAQLGKPCERGLFDVAFGKGNAHAPPCACRKLDPYVLVMQSTQDRTGEYATNGLDGARNRRVLVQGQVRVRLIVVIQIRPQ